MCIDKPELFTQTIIVGLVCLVLFTNMVLFQHALLRVEAKKQRKARKNTAGDNQKSLSWMMLNGWKQ